MHQRRMANFSGQYSGLVHHRRTGCLPPIYADGATSCLLLFSHPDISHGLSRQGVPLLQRDQLPQTTIDMLSDRWALHPDIDTDLIRRADPAPVDDGGVLNVGTRVMKLTRGKLMKQPDWDEWNASEFLQLDQYNKQHMFGQPVKVDDASAIFHLVWSYVVKELDSRKKARYICDGSPRSGQVRVLDHTYANCVDQTGSRIFYAISAAENLLIYGADVSNAFAEAPAPKQGFYIYPNKAFHDWWTRHKGNPPIPEGHVIPVLGAMQGHPESPRLWEKYIDKALRLIGLAPTVHEPCIYLGTVLDERVLFMRQVDDFAIATHPNALQTTSSI
jgi:hypothetical protein